MKNNNVLGNKIKEVRKELRLTQEQLSKRMSISRSTLRDIETGRYIEEFFPTNNIRFIAIYDEVDI